MALKIEFVVQSFSLKKRGVLAPSHEPAIKSTLQSALALAERLATTAAGVVVFEQHVDRSADIYNEPTIAWRCGDIPVELVDALGGSAPLAESIAA